MDHNLIKQTRLREHRVLGKWMQAHNYQHPQLQGLIYGHENTATDGQVQAITFRAHAHDHTTVAAANKDVTIGGKLQALAVRALAGCTQRQSGTVLGCSRRVAKRPLLENWRAHLPG